jgi:hypothetical protein
VLIAKLSFLMMPTVTNSQALAHGIFALEDVDVRAAYRRRGGHDKGIKRIDIGKGFSSSTVRPGSTKMADLILAISASPLDCAAT